MELEGESEWGAGRAMSTFGTKNARMMLSGRVKRGSGLDDDRRVESEGSTVDE